MKILKQLAKVFCLFFLILFFIAIAHSQFSEQGILRRELLEKIPKGTEVSAAHSIMEREGFICAPGGYKQLTASDTFNFFCGKCAAPDRGEYKCQEVYINYRDNLNIVTDISTDVRHLNHTIEYHSHPLKLEAAHDK